MCPSREGGRLMATVLMGASVHLGREDRAQGHAERTPQRRPGKTRRQEEGVSGTDRVLVSTM